MYIHVYFLWGSSKLESDSLSQVIESSEFGGFLEFDPGFWVPFEFRVQFWVQFESLEPRSQFQPENLWTVPNQT